MTIQEALKKYSGTETELLLQHVLKKPKEFLFMHPEHHVSLKQLASLKKMVKRRRSGEPIAYILGYKDFFGLRFKVNKNVLIPRPETEGIVESIKYKVESLEQKKLKILDVGTGSGCIIITIVKALGPRANGVEFFGSDISSAALKVAEQNAKILLNGKHTHTSTYECAIKFVQADLLKNIKGNFDIIIANLPYGWQAWKNNTTAETLGLKFEPKRALFTKEKGLMEIRRLLEQIAHLKFQPKLIYLEFDPRQKNHLARIIKKILPSWKAKFHKDFNNFWRYAEIKLF